MSTVYFGHITYNYGKKFLIILNIICFSFFCLKTKKPPNGGFFSKYDVMGN